jgi:hypothetical protein
MADDSQNGDIITLSGNPEWGQEETKENQQ